ncbi:polysaccharide biosynthesis tyrosine autokinase [Pedobacter sp. MC2016-24]|uniref:GumC family protein n=1 Tax=Pedobacter sp. MC2016-24 TaxID=2780090 RepID=UPI00187E726E|nr:polysaccharide biosynthesis tyrosine autokinase [Pedobacter sp. MC2016-24]MBE9599517.1 polysaccharide biosynthesis tyrosine autokinase [Pedobacter sp. MC2016-24]
MSTNYTTKQIDPFLDEEEKDNGQTLKSYIDKILANWFLFLIGVTLCTFLAVIYAKFADTAYHIDGKILVKDEKSGPSGSKGLIADMDLGSLLGGSSSAENEIEILKSRTLMTKVVRKLNLNIIHGMKGKLRSTEVEDALVPYTVQIVSQTDTIQPKSYQIDNITSRSLHLKSSDQGIDMVIPYGKLVKLPQYTLLFTFKPGYKMIEGDFVYSLNIQSIDSRAESLIKSFNAVITSKQSTVISVSFDYSVPSKGEQILQTLMDLYLRDNLEDKKRIADSTLHFIDGQLAGVTADLKGIETQIETFKESNQLADITAQSQALVTNASDYYKKLNEAELQLNVLQSISAYVNNPANKRIIPSSLNVQDPVFTTYVGLYNELLIQRDKAMLAYTEENPIVRNLDEQIETVRKNLVKSFNSYRNNLIQAKTQLVKNNNSITSEIKKVPKQEREFLDYTRQQNLRQQLYIFLLEKREETAISRTSTFSSSQIIDSAKSAHAPFSPKKGMVYLVGMLIGLVLPLGYLSLKEMLNTRIQTKQDLTSGTSIPVVGEISHNADNSSLVIDSKSRSIISEQFRGLRTNLQFLLKADQPNVIMITSSMSGEGKSFISLNLANALAIGNKTVVLMELDLRKPKLTTNIGMVNKSGFSNYVATGKLSIEDIITPTTIHKNVSLISSGPIPPNPAELLLNEKLKTLIDFLKEKFDYVIIDSAPVGLVSDALLIENFVDLTLYITRQAFTFKSQLSIVNDLHATEKLRKVAIVVNDISSNSGSYYGYGYGGYGYGYGYGSYGLDEPEKKWWNFKKS